MNDFEREILAIHEKELQKKKAQEWGRLGGRPKTPEDKKKAKIISIRLNADDYEKIINDFSKSGIENFADFCRMRLKNVNPENYAEIKRQNEILLAQAGHLQKIKNYFNMGLYDPETREKYRAELDAYLQGIKNIVLNGR